MPRASNLTREERRERDLAKNRAWYRANPERHRSQQEARMRRNYAIIDAAKNVPCTDCGGRFHPCAMHFDHVRGTKHLPIARMKTASLENLYAELAKCDVRCANCHAVRTWGGNQRYEGVSS